MQATQDAAPEHDVVVPLRSRRRKRALVAQKINHVVPAIALASGGGQLLASGAHGAELALAVAELVTSALFIGAIVRDVNAARRPAVETAHHGHGIDWTDIFAAGMLLAEAAERWHLRHRIPGATLLTAAATLGVGLLHGRLAGRRQRRRSLRVTQHGIYIGGRPFRSMTARWDEIAVIRVTDHEAEIRTHAGRSRRINLDDMENAAHVRDALGHARGRLLAAQERGAALEKPA